MTIKSSDTDKLLFFFYRLNPLGYFFQGTIEKQVYSVQIIDTNKAVYQKYECTEMDMLH